ETGRPVARWTALEARGPRTVAEGAAPIGQPYQVVWPGKRPARHEEASPSLWNSVISQRPCPDHDGPCQVADLLRRRTPQTDRFSTSSIASSGSSCDASLTRAFTCAIRKAR